MMGVFLVGVEKLVVGLDCRVELVEEEHVLRTQEAGVTGHLVILELVEELVGEVQAGVEILQLVVAGGSLGEHFCKLPEAPSVDLSKRLCSRLPVRVLTAHQGVGIVEAQVVNDGGDIVVFLDRGLEGGRGTILGWLLRA